MKVAGSLRTHGKREYHLAFALFNKTFRNPQFQPSEWQLRDAAGAALRLAAGDDPTTRPGVEECVHLHVLARQWLARPLEQAVRLMKTGRTADRRAARALVADWPRDPSLALARDPKYLAALPDEVRKPWEELWAEVARVLGPEDITRGPAPRVVAE